MSDTQRTLRTAAALLVLVSVFSLGQDLLGSNEAGKLALALQQVQPSWSPHDWYLNTPQSYQWLFQQISGHLLKAFGVPLGAMASRLAGYSLWAWAAANLCTCLGLGTAVSLGAVALFLSHQSLIAGEWMLGSAEPKTFAYAALLLAFTAWQRRQWLPGGLWSGLACSFHVLVGGYGLIALGLTALIRRETWNRQAWITSALGLGLGALPLITLVRHHSSTAEQPSASGAIAGPSADWIYTYLRNPHHLVPSSWSSAAWLQAGLGLLVFAIALIWTWRDQGPRATQRRCLGWWCGLSLVPMTAGLLISLWDHEGHWLRFYPFRLADSLIPLGSALLLGCQFQELGRRSSGALALGLAALISLSPHTTDTPNWNPFQTTSTEGETAKAELYRWIRSHQPLEGRIATPPANFEDLTLLTGRAGIAQFKQVPNRPEELQEWFQRMQALGGDPDFWQHATGFKARRRLMEGYRQLEPQQLAALADRYHASAVITAHQQPGPSHWQQVYSNPEWSLWSLATNKDAEPGAAFQPERRQSGHREASARPTSN